MDENNHLENQNDSLENGLVADSVFVNSEPVLSEESNVELLDEDISSNPTIVDSMNDISNSPTETPMVEPSLIDSPLPNDSLISNSTVDEKGTTEEKTLPINNEVVFKEDTSKKYVGYKSRLIMHLLFPILSTILILALLFIYANISITSSFQEKSYINYFVCLSENEYYSESCLGENVEYIAAITDTIRATFDYSASYAEKDDRTFEYFIRADLLIRTIGEPEKTLLSKEKKLTDIKDSHSSGNVVTVLESIEIPFQEYNEYAQKYKNDYSLLSNSSLTVSLVEHKEDNDRVISSFEIPLTKSTFSIEKEEMKTHQQFYVVDALKTRRNIILVIAGLLLLISIFTWIRFVRFLSSTMVHESEYNKKLKKILNTYDRVIITLNEDKKVSFSDNVYKVNSFLELLDVRDTIDKPILYYKVNNVKTEFYVEDGDKLYNYTMKEADIDNLNRGNL